MSNIHSTAIISNKAEIGNDVSVGPHTIIEDNVTIGDNCNIASSALIASGSVLGKGVKVYHGAVIGTVPQDLKFGGEETKAIIGDNTVVREYATINRGTDDKWETKVGANCLLMAYSHVAHDCLIGNNVILANSVNLAGHIEIGDYAIIGGIVPVHQFVKIGAHAMVGGGYRVPQDICPYSMSGGYPLKIIGLNKIGLKRRGFSSESLKELEKLYKLLFFSKLNTSQALERVESEVEKTAEVNIVLDFIKSSKRGLVK